MLRKYIPLLGVVNPGCIYNVSPLGDVLSGFCFFVADMNSPAPTALTGCRVCGVECKGAFMLPSHPAYRSQGSSLRITNTKGKTFIHIYCSGSYG